MATAFAFAWWGFGSVPAMLAFAFLWLSPLARFDFIGGSLLRWDWLAALVIGAAAFARGWAGAAGALLGYATLARIFPALFLLPLAVKWVQGRRTGDGRRGPGGASSSRSAVLLVGGRRARRGRRGRGLALGLRRQDPAPRGGGLSSTRWGSAP